MIQAKCSVCGKLFDAGQDIRCPACRATAVWEAFRPVDPKRTARAIQRLHSLEMTNLDSPEAIAKLWEGLAWEQAQSEGMSFEEYTWGFQHVVQEDTPKYYDAMYRIPRGEAAQIYELRRLFRL